MEHHLTVARTARYQQLGELSGRTRRVWFVCHGYGQLAAYFVRHFAFLADGGDDTVVIAPEGLSRFYLQSNGGRVGASWMTRDDRLAEIDDHVGFLNQLASLVLARCPAEVEITVLGFSQGTATVSRWLSCAHFGPRTSFSGPAASPKTLLPPLRASSCKACRLPLFSAPTTNTFPWRRPGSNTSTCSSSGPKRS